MSSKKSPRRKPTPKKPAVPVWERAFLTAFALTGNVRLSCETADIHPSTVYDRRDTNDEFAAAFDQAREDAADRLEQEARRRAVQGVDEPVFGSGGAGVGTVEVGTIRRYSDTLLIFLLKGARPEKYRDNHKVEHTGAVAQLHVYIPDNGRDANPETE